MNPLKTGDPELVGGYRLLGRLGTGGMAQVFLGASPGGRKVAVKVIRSEYSDDAEFRRRFAREIAAARQVGGFHTAAVVDADPDADPPWMVTAYIPGPSLSEAVSRNGPLEVSQVRELGAALAEGLTAIHACGLIHRDLKPGNIILGPDGPRIIDFGVARTANASSLTTVNALIGTYGYMAPEQLGRKDVTFRSDLFALGGVLVFAATGHGPFDADELPAVIGRILSEPPDLSPLTGPLRDVLDACLDKDPDRRPDLADLIAYFAVPEQAPPRPPAVLPDQRAPRPGDAPTSVPGQQPTTIVGLPAANTTVAPGDPAGILLACSPLIGHSGPITLVAFSPDGKFLATASVDGRVRLWDTGTWRQAGPDLSPQPPHRVGDGGFAQLVFTPDSRALLAKPPGTSAVFGWQVGSWQPLSLPVRTWARFISPNGRFLATEGTGAPALCEWDPAALRHTPFPLRRKTGWRIGFLAAFSPDGGFVAATDPGDDIGLWDTQTRQRRQVLRRYQRSFDPVGQGLVPYALSDMVISPGGGFLAALGQARDNRGGDVRFLKLWSIADPSRRRRRLFERTSATAISRWNVAFAPDGSTLASTFDGRLRLWDTASLTPTDLGDPGEDAVLEFAAGGGLLAEAGRYRLRLWDAAAGVVAAAGPEVKTARDAISGAAFSPDGSLIATAEGTAARVWHVPPL
ncbi:MAG TPA: WD40 repeat domain-containing serine/threonine protein kinase [Trebonia sp.]|nr:WD40 repeat domain-containing serine/threonine protein kinase [Trebonia sp.]